MKQFEDDLRRALRVDNPPSGLAERIVQRVEGRPQLQTSGGRHRLLAVAAGVLVVGGLWVGREVRDYREGEGVKDELMVGLRVAGASLRQVQERVLAPWEESREPVDSTNTEER